MVAGVKPRLLRELLAYALDFRIAEILLTKKPALYHP